MSNRQKPVLKPVAIPIADAKQISGGTTAIRYIENTHDIAKGIENFMPENQFLVQHSHISPKFRYMRVLSRFGAYAVTNFPPERLITSARRTSSITSSLNAS